MRFICREYPCDHYTSVINVTLLMTGCPRVDVYTTAVQLLQVLDKRFFGNVGPLQNEGDKGKFSLSSSSLHSHIDVVCLTVYVSFPYSVYVRMVLFIPYYFHSNAPPSACIVYTNIHAYYANHHIHFLTHKSAKYRPNLVNIKQTIYSLCK